MNTMTDVRYPLDQLKHQTHLTDPELAATVGITERHLIRLKAQGLTPLQADRYANACGQHPAWIWGDTWYTSTSPDLDGDARTPCRCGRKQVPLGRICDRCGHDRHAPDVTPLADTG